MDISSVSFEYQENLTNKQTNKQKAIIVIYKEVLATWGKYKKNSIYALYYLLTSKNSLN